MLDVKEMAEPRPGPGQLLVEPIAAGICGGDLNAMTLTDAFLDASVPQWVEPVTGCGPVGIGAVWELAHRGIHPIVASDPSPRRRALAAEFGAHVVVDPAADDPIDAWRDVAAPGTALYVYEAAGKPGLLNSLITKLPCMHGSPWSACA